MMAAAVLLRAAQVVLAVQRAPVEPVVQQQVQAEPVEPVEQQVVLAVQRVEPVALPPVALRAAQRVARSARVARWQQRAVPSWEPRAQRRCRQP